MRACYGNGDSQGHAAACVNLGNIFERGNKKLGIEPNLEISQEFKRKAYLHSAQGILENSTKNAPNAGQVI